mmetsp:Transcript_4416/g.5433  ORF Transcript_4416/g.5433 Transcript_4416/m.5433 type:complete len:175 (-) Transcript_4416:2224-2748(-)
MKDDEASAATLLRAQDPLSASLTTLATEAHSASTKNLMSGGATNEEDAKGPLNEESSSNVLFHPPAAHEEHSADSENEDSAAGFGQSLLPATNGGAERDLDIDDEANSVIEDGGQSKKRRKKRNKKKKKNQGGVDGISEVSINDQSVIDDSIDEDLGREGSQNTRPATNARKRK